MRLLVARTTTAEQFVRYLGIGSLCFCTNLSILYIGASVLNWGYVNSLLVSAVIVSPMSWWMNRRFAFQSSALSMPELGRFLMATALTTGLTISGMAVLVEFGGISYLVANVVLAAGMTALSFFILKLQVFIRR